jgi:hypothetical protein
VGFGWVYGNAVDIRICGAGRTVAGCGKEAGEQYQ